MFEARSACTRGSAGLHRVAGVAHRRQRLVVDLDRGRGVFGEMAAVGNHHGDGLADVADFVAGQRNLRARRPDRRIGHQHRDLAGGDARRHVVGGEHRVNAGHGARRGAVDLAEAGMGVRAPHERGVQHAGQVHVIDELAPPGEQRRVFEARDPCAEVLRAHMPFVPRVALARPGGRASIGRSGRQGKGVCQSPCFGLAH